MISAKTYLKAASVEEAIAIAKKSAGKFRYLAGGTDVMVNRFQGNDDSDTLIDISEIETLKKISINSTHLIIGTLVCLDEIENYQSIKNQFPTIIEAIKSIASPTIRKTATLGGNLLCENRCLFYNQSEWWRDAAGRCLRCNGEVCLASGGKKNCYSKFVSDSAVALISLNATIEFEDENGSSVIPLENIYSGDGINPRQLNKTAIIKSVLIPFGQDFRSVYKKLRKRETIDFTSLSTAVTVRNNKLRIVLGGVNVKPVIIDGSIHDDLTSLISQAVSNTRIVDNDTYSRSYRKEMISVFLNRSFKELNLVQ